LLVARSPGPIYHSTFETLEKAQKKGGVVIKPDHAHPAPDVVDPHGQRDSWIKGLN